MIVISDKETRVSREPSAMIAVIVLCTGWLSLVGCRETPRPAGETPAATPRTAPATSAAPTQPAAKQTAPPASMPAEASAAGRERPKPPYHDVPPYRVAFTIDSPDDPQAGWLHIESFADKGRAARVSGLFPEANKIDVDTDNVSALTLDLSMLPIRPKHRIILRIDRQGIDISPRHRGKIRLARSPTGQWTVTTPPPP